MEQLNDIQKFAKLRLEEFVSLKVDQQIARICVWSVHHERVEQARRLAEYRDCMLSEDDVYEIAFFFRKVWQIDAPRDERARCFLCFEPLPTHVERLCHCFRIAEVGVWIEATPENIAWLKKTYPGTWFSKNMETIHCQKCHRNSDVSAGTVANKFRKGRSWRSPKFCQDCFTENQKQRDHGGRQVQKARTRKPPLRVPVKAAPEQAPTLEDLHAKVAEVSPPVAES